MLNAKGKLSGLPNYGQPGRRSLSEHGSTDPRKETYNCEPSSLSQAKETYYTYTGSFGSIAGTTRSSPPSGVGRVHVIGDEVNSTSTDFWKKRPRSPTRLVVAGPQARRIERRKGASGFLPGQPVVWGRGWGEEGGDEEDVLTGGSVG